VKRISLRHWGALYIGVLVAVVAALAFGAGVAGLEQTQGPGFAAVETTDSTATTTEPSATTTTTTDAPTSTTDAPTTTTGEPTTTTTIGAPTTTTTEVPLVLTRYQQADYRLTYLNSWYACFTSSALGGSFYGTDSAGAGVMVNFTGTSISLIARTTPWYGKAIVTLDGVDEYVDFYSSAQLHKRVVYTKQGLAPGAHTLVIKRSGEKSAPSLGYGISLDALDVTGSLTQAPAAPEGSEGSVLPKVEWLGLRLVQGSSGPAVAWLERKLTDLSYRPGPVDGYFDSRTRMAVIAFEKWEGLTRDGVMTGNDWVRLASAGRPVPRYYQNGKWIEVNRQKQVLLYCVDGRVERTLAVSTGSSRVGIVTPAGAYRVTRKNTYERLRYKPLYLTWSLLAIHGYTSVPVYPASHGCIRTTWADMDELNPLIPVWTTVRVY
jgi:peptidoglycan hydrolase-like protein with peptidoglycan-binding domain